MRRSQVRESHVSHVREARQSRQSRQRKQRKPGQKKSVSDKSRGALGMPEGNHCSSEGQQRSDQARMSRQAQTSPCAYRAKPEGEPMSGVRPRGRGGEGAELQRAGLARGALSSRGRRSCP